MKDIPSAVLRALVKSKFAFISIIVSNSTLVIRPLIIGNTAKKYHILLYIETSLVMPE
jgi:hypothetical protein